MLLEGTTVSSEVFVPLIEELPSLKLVPSGTPATASDTVLANPYRLCSEIV